MHFAIKPNKVKTKFLALSPACNAKPSHFKHISFIIAKAPTKEDKRPSKTTATTTTNDICKLFFSFEFIAMLKSRVLMLSPMLWRYVVIKKQIIRRKSHSVIKKQAKK